MIHRTALLALSLFLLAACSAPQPTRPPRTSYGPPTFSGRGASGGFTATGNAMGTGGFKGTDASFSPTSRTGSTTGASLPSGWTGFGGH